LNIKKVFTHIVTFRKFTIFKVCIFFTNQDSEIVAFQIQIQSEQSNSGQATLPQYSIIAQTAPEKGSLFSRMQNQNDAMQTTRSASTATSSMGKRLFNKFTDKARRIKSSGQNFNQNNLTHMCFVLHLGKRAENGPFVNYHLEDFLTPILKTFELNPACPGLTPRPLSLPLLCYIINDQFLRLVVHD
jgi:hypothetical protein